MDLQTSLFKLTMKNQAFKAMKSQEMKTLGITKLWHQLARNNLLALHFFGFIKLAQMVFVLVIGYIENERTFS